MTHLCPAVGSKRRLHGRACPGIALLLCAAVPAFAGGSGAPTASRTVLTRPTVWKGEVVVRTPVTVAKTASLTVKPGTRVVFDLPETSADEEPEPWLLVLGSIDARGTPAAPILFAPRHPRQNQLENMVEAQQARLARFRSCTFERGPWGLHLHDTNASVEHCLFRDNYGGMRFKGGPVVVRGNRFVGNRIGLRCLEASPVIENNAFEGNLTGVFFRQEVRRAVVRGNDFDNTEYDLKLGEGQDAEVDASGNWWGAAEAGSVTEKIFDGADSEGVGRVLIEPRLSTRQRSAPEAGAPR